MTPRQSTKSERKLLKLKENKLNELAIKLDKDIRGIKSDLFLSDVDKLIANKEYTKAENKLKDVDSSPFLDNEVKNSNIFDSST